MGDSKVQEVLLAAAKIVSDFGHHQTKDYFSNFDPQASFIFYTHKNRLNSRLEYEELWAKWETEDGFRVHGCRSTNQKVQLIGQIAVFTHEVSSDIEFGGEVSTIEERETIIFELQNSRWIAVHEHLSPAMD